MALPSGPMFQEFMQALEQNAARWRIIQRRGGIMRVSESSLIQCLTRHLNITDLDEMAAQLKCNWAYNHKQRIVYFIPLEMTDNQ